MKKNLKTKRKSYTDNDADCHDREKAKICSNYVLNISIKFKTRIFLLGWLKLNLIQ